MNVVPLKKRKMNVIVDECDFTLPETEYKRRKKCAQLNKGIAIKYNKLVYNFDNILRFNHFRKYCVFFDILSKRHLIYHKFRIDLLQKLNCFDFTPNAYKKCNCDSVDFNFQTGFLLCFNSDFMERQKYINHKDSQSEKMTKLYKDHSILSKDNYFYDNRINQCFLMRIKEFEELNPLIQLEKNTWKLLCNNMYKTPPNIDVCDNCRNIKLATYETWRMVRFSNCIDLNTICDHVLKIDNMFLIPNYLETAEIDESTKIIVYKTSKSNIVFLYNNVFYVLNSQNLLVIFNINTFRNVKFFCNFNFHFIKQLNVYNDTNFININKD